MDFSDFSSYPMVANTDYSPTTDAFSYPDTFDKAYLADSYSTQPDYSLDSFFDCPVSSIESTSAYASSAPKRTSFTGSQSMPSPYQTTFNTAPFGQINSLPQSSNFNFEPITSDFENTSPHNETSPTPSLCGDAPLAVPHSPSPSPRPINLKRESEDDSPLSLSEPSKRPQRKRGRPRLDRTPTTSTDSSSLCSSLKNKQSHRLPHNQVERKYREGLNTELERLRRAVPTLPQSDEGGVMGQPKPSKAMVLAGAIEYIKRIERERDEALAEVERLRDGMGSQGRWKRQEINFDNL